MPTYRYRCGTCGEEFEVWQSMQDPALTIHRDAVPDSDCDGTLAKVLSPAGIVLKGSGFYKNDSRSSNGSRSGASRPDTRDEKRDTDSSSSSTGSDTPSSDSTKAQPTSSDTKKSETKKSHTKKSDSSSTPSSTASSKK